MGFLPVFLAVVAALRTGNGWKEAAVFSAVPAFLVVWISAFRLDVSSGILSYRTLFRDSRSLPISAIESADMTIAPVHCSARLSS